MVFVKKSYEEIRDNVLAQITKDIVNEEHVYEPNRAKYELANTPVRSIVRIDGVVDGCSHTFNQGVDYRISEDMPDGVSGVVKIIVDGGDAEEIKRVIDDVRAAGITVEFLRPKPVHIDVNLTVTVHKGATPSKVQKAVEADVMSYLSSLEIGDDVIYSRIVGAAVNVEGVHKVAEMTVKAYRTEGEEAIKSIEENVEITSEERAVARAVNVLIRTSEGKKPE